MGLLSRFLGALLAPPEDPRKATASSSMPSGDPRVSIERALYATAEARRLLDERAAQLGRLSAEQSEQAREHLRGGREDLARLALRLAFVTAREQEATQSHAAELQIEEQRLRLAHQQAATRVEQLALRQQLAAVRSSASEAALRLGEALDEAASDSGALDELLTLTDTATTQVAARARAFATAASSDPLSYELSDADEDQAVSSQLGALKAELGHHR